MTATVDCAEFNAALKTVRRAVPGKTFMPIMSDVLIVIRDGLLRLAGTNGAASITAEIPAEHVTAASQVAIDALLLGELVGTLAPTEPLVLTIDAVRHSLALRSGRNTALINGDDPLQFPFVPVAEWDRGFALDGQLLRAMINQVEFAASRYDNVPALAGVLIRFDGDKLTLVAADGHRMAIAERFLDGRACGGDGRLDLLLPVKSCRLLASLIGEASGPLTILADAATSHVHVLIGAVAITTRMIVADFPDYQTIVPRESATIVDLGREALHVRVKRAAAFAKEDGDFMRLEFQPSADDLEPATVVISAAAHALGKTDATLDVERIDGPSGFAISFNAGYLQDILGSLPTNSVTVGFNGERSAAVFRPAGSSQSTHVLMPMIRDAAR